MLDEKIERLKAAYRKLDDAKEAIDDIKHNQRNMINSDLYQCMWTAVSYTHLDVYKRQVIDNAMSVVEAVRKQKNYQENFPVKYIQMETDDAWTRDCLLYTSRCV